MERAAVEERNYLAVLKCAGGRLSWWIEVISSRGWLEALVFRYVAIERWE